MSSTRELAVAGIPEHDWVLWAASDDYHPGSDVRSGLDPEPNWNRVIDCALRHKVLPLLHRKLQQRRCGMVPANYGRQLERLFQANRRHNLRFAAEWWRLEHLFREQHLQVIPLRGPALTEDLYHDLALRQFADLDVLVPERQVSASVECWISQGYQPFFDLAPRQQRALIHRDCQLSFRHPHKEILVELHWEILPRHFRCPLAPVLWEAFQRAPRGEDDCHRLAAEETLFILVLHGHKHLWGRVGWIRDLAQLLRNNPGLDWAHISEVSKRSGWSRLLSVGLLAAVDLLQAPVPEKVLRQARRDRHAQRLMRQVAQRLFRPEQPTGILDTTLFHWRSLARATERIRYSLGFLLTPTPAEWNLLPLPAALFSFYYLLRPARLAARYGWALPRRGSS